MYIKGRNIDKNGPHQAKRAKHKGGTSWEVLLTIGIIQRTSTHMD